MTNSTVSGDAGDTSGTGDTKGTATGTKPAKPGGLFARLYLGTGAFDIIGKRKRWYVLTGLIVLVCIGSMIFRGFTPGIEFVGGTQIQMPSQTASGQSPTVEDVEQVTIDASGQSSVTVQTIGSGDSRSVQIRTEKLDAGELFEVKTALFEEFQPLNTDGEPSVDSISDSAVSGSWGGEVSRQAVIALLVFVVLVVLFLSLYFERRMAIAAISALVSDLITTAGVYSLIGFEVTPATVIGLLTIMGYSLYDTVVVFDRVKENARGLLGLTRQTYAESANLALNQTLMRSINTSITSLLPVLGLLVIGVGLLGAGTLKDLALVMTVGIATGAYSSIFLATPVLVDLKMRERRYQEQAARVMARREAVARRAAERGDGAEADDRPADAAGDESVDPERREKALAAAASVPARANRPSARPGRGGGKSGRPSGKGGRPSGKRRR